MVARPAAFEHIQPQMPMMKPSGRATQAVADLRAHGGRFRIEHTKTS